MTLACSSPRPPSKVPGEQVEFIPGPFEAPDNPAFRKAGKSLKQI